jgi:hypothetical protein
MAVDKLAEGIRSFARAQEKLEEKLLNEIAKMQPTATVQFSLS